jgi:tetratricopeptide (TPR) repeat protein
MGLAYGALGDHEKQLEFCMKALTIWKEVLPENHPDLALSYNNVGFAYCELGDHKKQLEFRMKALTIREDLPEGLSVQPLLKTTTAAYGKTAGFAMQTTDREDSDLRGPFLLGAVSERQTGTALSTMIWFPSGYLLEDNIDTTVSGGNSQLLIGCVQHLSGDSSGITVPGKTLGGGKLLVNTTEKAILSILMMVVLPLGILGAGIVVVRRRKRR